ncbi:hypothetical protein [Micromonospora sp. NBC_01796]|uniref:hypothetical protein n=1 Tax=Micromonospora sp. NBC_01796 TaxID=2975987 RepID=UPI002DDA2F45|nr:hypothetical protein [Micromonospora sp. NBC_01796]WSA86585.1 hypothetical protein OIE47_02880 [Micromonospora sp. NBC_01796]
MTRTLVRGRRAAGGLLAAAMLLSACTWHDGRWSDDNPDRTAAAESDRAADHAVAGARNDRREATLDLLNGSDVVRVTTAGIGGDLYRISTPQDAKVRPSVHVDGDTVLAGLAGTGRAGPAIVTIVLSDAVRWRIRLGGGAGEEIVDLTGGRVAEVDFSAGTNRAEVTLPPASGTVRVVMGGGASQFLVHLTGNAPARVRAGGGAGTVTVDGSSRSGVAGGTVITPPAWETATDRYDIDATAGVSTLTVDRR